MIRLCDDYVIDTDSMTFQVGKLAIRKDKDGKPTDAIQNPVYYPTLAGCISWVRNDLIRRKVQTLDCDIKTAVQALTALDRDFKAKVLEAVGKADTK